MRLAEAENSFRKRYIVLWDFHWWTDYRVSKNVIFLASRVLGFPSVCNGIPRTEEEWFIHIEEYPSSNCIVRSDGTNE